jgi:nucleoside-diphosphate-sugar epimerase
MKPRILLTGGAGFIGSHLAEGFLSKNYPLRIIDNLSTGKINNINHLLNDIEFMEGDIRDIETVSKAMLGVNIVVHHAALPSVPRSISDPITTNQVNVSGTLNLLWASVENKIDKFIFASSSSIYGDSTCEVKNENLTPNPLSPYAVTKLTSENYCRVFSRAYGLNTVCLRYFNVFGPKQDPSSQYSAVIPKFIKLISEDKKPIIFGDGTQSRDFTFVKNVVDANILAIENVTGANLVMNCACNSSITLNELVKEINRYLGKNIEPIYENERIGDIKHSCADIRLAKEKINYFPNVLFKEGLEATIREFIN